MVLDKEAEEEEESIKVWEEKTNSITVVIQYVAVVTLVLQLQQKSIDTILVYI